MKILYIHQYFKTPQEGGGIRSYHIAKAMVAAGHEVEMLTAHNQPEYVKINIEGITVHYLPVAYDNSFSKIRRIMSFMSFFLKATKLSFKLKKDLIYATSTPLSIGAIALCVKWITKTPYIFEVRDLWPKVPIELGFIRNRFVIGVLNSLEKLIYKNAKHIIALSPGIKQHISQFNTPIAIVPNFADTAFFQATETPVNDKLTISYIGTIGFANGLDTLIDLAIVAQNSYPNQFQFNIMGDGAEKNKLQAKVTASGICNVTFHDFSGKEKVRLLMQNADVMYVSFAPFPILGETTSPNKFFDALAMKKVIVVNFEGWLKELLFTHHAGFFHDAKHHDKLLLHLLEAKKNAVLWENMSLSSENLAINNFELNHHLSKIIGLL